jgi:hypothetical protein
VKKQQETRHQRERKELGLGCTGHCQARREPEKARHQQEMRELEKARRQQEMKGRQAWYQMKNRTCFL